MLILLFMRLGKNFLKSKLSYIAMKLLYGCRRWMLDLSKMKPLGGWLGWATDEGRGKQRYARGRCKRPLIPGSPNGYPGITYLK
jgi:hypothetical protein